MNVPRRNRNNSVGSSGALRDPGRSLRRCCIVLRRDLRLIGRYRIERQLGAGGFGVVFEAEHLLIERRVAMKILRPEVSADAALLTRFEREAIAAAAIGPPNIVESHGEEETTKLGAKASTSVASA